MEGFAEDIGLYGVTHPDVTFSVDRMERDEVQPQLANYRIDLAGVIQPEAYPNLSTLAVAPLDIKAVVHPSHPLAEFNSVTFNDLLPHPLVLPPIGSLRDLLDAAARRQDFELRPILECELPFAGHILEHAGAVGFSANTATRQETGLSGMVSVPISRRDVSTPNLHLVQLRGRALSVAASRFADRIVQRFAQYAGEV